MPETTPDPMEACYHYYKETYNRPPTVVEIWAWLDQEAS